MSVGKHSVGTPNPGGYQPTQQAQQQFADGVAQTQPTVAQTLSQISGDSSPAVNTMVTQQMSPRPGSPEYYAAGGLPGYVPPANHSMFQPQQQSQPITMPGGQQLDLNPQPQDPQSLINQINWETMRTMGLMKRS
jgi:hypothetical protein